MNVGCRQEWVLAVEPQMWEAPVSGNRTSVGLGSLPGPVMVAYEAGPDRLVVEGASRQKRRRVAFWNHAWCESAVSGEDTAPS